MLEALLLAAWMAAPPGPAAIDRLTAEFSEELLALMPLAATTVGDPRYNDRLAIDIGEPHRAARRELYERYLARLGEIDPEGLAPAGRLTYRVFRRDLESGLAGLEFPDHLLPVSFSITSLPNRLARLAAADGVQPLATVADYDAFRRRLEGFPDWIEAAIANMEIGLERGIVQPCAVVERALGELAVLAVEAPGDSVFWQPIERLPVALPAAERQRLAAEYAATLGERVLPAYRRLHGYLAGPYRAGCRESPGLAALPGGEAWYAWLVAHHTTTTLGPEEIFQLGRREIRRIRNEMRILLRQLGLGDDWGGFFARLNGRREAWLFDPERVLAEYRSLGERLAGELPELFVRVPETAFEIRPVASFLAASAPRGFYARPSADGSRPGVFWVNLDGEAYPRWGMEALFLHEVVPGHHFQISLAQESDALPRYRRLAPNTAYVEGWALYAESLGSELGLYRDPLQRWGRLASEMLRACRLVGDTALHAKGWSRERLVSYLDHHCFGIGSGEIDRWSVQPAQALAYKIGQLRIRELRRRAERRLGRAFDPREFHEAVLAEGALPLDLLEERIGAWIERRAAGG